ncbi:DNA repair protein RadA [Clostridium pasteurianum DSM 525 = ATCC 6013]|uniref:DNA repair protein RadA n=1 Tax=Clostridium pasteurianum DSM 525 = ATCC 6013 TaxID=1262449 RepID=A0A0H3JAQ8_CLOPA|nr:DNA repair protein RadA [Clostridium pasteurianum]AJA49758.1 DNA repair protein RadA [Clostridium pasteurianum DSM 525 = ATCC 6013]AJA53746.1 DNA repair protein RadA [Clostridium pasteurianum DSM 525 = ATCC 6013]AOZ76908.1 DNA repair protein RadA [Clostridium pasteurianum DSM 525 = ATCC 6013]AOZ80705.1 DNA repair protein RadA [Clostridium pasteurianum]ELP57551.1 DNA repair protein RadA [Clostridium pasteurianum DSM 525 = ATCC 6013]
MPKNKTTFICQECGYESLKWMGKCPSCGNWNSFVEELAKSNKNNVFLDKNNESKCIVNIKSGEHERYDTDIKELNRVLGGGLVKGSLTLISGAPGIGKSTLLLQTANNIAEKYGKVLYVSGEESEEQIKMRSDRLGIISSNLFVFSEINMDIILNQIEQLKPIFVIIDSIQTIFKPSITSAPGSVSQVRECANEIMRTGKIKGISFFIVAHVTKQGELAGPRVLEHMVDSVLSFEGQRTEEFRILRTIKNRFGTTSEIGVFEMEEEGLVEVNNPSNVFLEETSFKQEGSIVIGIMEGTRPILVEIQALVSETKAIMPRRTAVGIDSSRLNLILAVLEKKLKISFYNCDVYVNVVGGLNITGTFADLGLALALISSVKGRSINIDRMIAIGEIGLTGEIRPISYCDRIVNEAEKMGFENIVIPKRNREKIKRNNINVIGVSSLREVINKVF